MPLHIFARHAEPEFSIAERRSGGLNSATNREMGLSEFGKGQTQILRDYLLDKIKVVYASPFRRTLETASPFEESKIQIISSEDLKEIHFGGNNFKAFRNWLADEPNSKAQESFGDAYKRACRVLEFLERSEEPTLLLSHQLFGCVLQLAAQKLEDPRRIFRGTIRLGYAQCFTLVHEKGCWKICEMS